MGAYNAWNKIVPMYLKDMSIFFGNQYAFGYFIKFIEMNENLENKKFLILLARVFAYNSFKENAMI